MNQFGKLGLASLIGMGGYIAYRKVKNNQYQQYHKKFQLRFWDPTQRLINEDLENGEKYLETNDKLLHPKSHLYLTVDSIRCHLMFEYGNAISPKKMDYHIKLINDTEEYSEDKLINRCQEIEGLDIEISPERIEYGTHHVAIKGPAVSGYGETQIIIAYFHNRLPDNIREVVKKSFIV